MAHARRSVPSRSSFFLTLVGVFFLAPAALADLPGKISPTFKMAIRLVEGGREIVSVAELTETSLVAETGQEYPWDSLVAASAFDAMRKAADRQRADDWLWVGVKMLERDEATLAKRAFKAAERADASSSSIADRALALHRSGSDARMALEVDAPTKAGDQLDDTPAAAPREQPARRTGGRHLWPVLTDAQQQTAIERTRSWAQELLDNGGVRIRSHESPNYIVFTNGGENYARRVLDSLENMHRELMEIFFIPKETVMYHGKCVIFIQDSHQAFVNFEERVFDFDAKEFGGVFHLSPTHVCVSSYNRHSPVDLETLLVHETTHAFMYRYKSQYRLPTWANEGLADYMAAHLVREGSTGQRAWGKAREFVMNGGDPGDIMAQTYENGEWPNDYSYPVSHMIVRFMIMHKAPEFRAWIEDIKDGRHWVESMAERFSPSPDKRISPDILAQGFAEHMRRERKYTR